MSESATPESGPLSFEQAVESLTPSAAPEEQEQAEAAPAEAAAGDEIEAEASPAEDTEGEAETPAEGEEGAETEGAETPLDPPLYWKPEAKDAFAKLPPEVQAEILAQEGPREAAAAKAKAEAAEKARSAEAELGKVQQLANHFADFLPQALETFKSRWGDAPDWIAYAQEYGADAMSIAKVQHEQELALLQQTVRANAEAQALAREAEVKAEFTKLAEIAPDLADPTTGPAKRTEISNYLVNQGIDADNVRNISAAEMVLARKAMLYDQAQAALKAKPNKPAAVPQRSTVRPSAAVSQSPTQRTAAQVANRFAQTRSVDDAVALLLTGKK